MIKFNVKNAIKGDFSGIVSYSYLQERIQEYTDNINKINTDENVKFLIRCSGKTIKQSLENEQKYLDVYTKKMKMLEKFLMNMSVDDIEKMFSHPISDELSTSHYGEPKYLPEYDNIKKEYINIITKKEINILRNL